MRLEPRKVHVDITSFTDNGDDIIETSFYPYMYNESQCIMSFYGGVLKILVHLQSGIFDDRPFATAVSAKVHRTLNGIRVNLINKNGEEKNYHLFTTLENLFDPEKNILKIKECEVKLYYEGNLKRDGFELKTTLPGIITDEYYNYEVNEENIHFIDNGEDIIFSTSEFVMSFFGGVFKAIVKRDFFDKYENISDVQMNYYQDYSFFQQSGEIEYYCTFPQFGWNIDLWKRNLNFYTIYDREFHLHHENNRQYRIKFYFREDDDHIILLKELPFTITRYGM